MGFGDIAVLQRRFCGRQESGGTAVSLEGWGGAGRFSSPSLVLLHSARHDFSKSGWGSAGVFGSVGLKAGKLEAGEGLTALWG